MRYFINILSLFSFAYLAAQTPVVPAYRSNNLPGNPKPVEARGSDLTPNNDIRDDNYNGTPRTMTFGTNNAPGNVNASDLHFNDREFNKGYVYRDNLHDIHQYNIPNPLVSDLNLYPNPNRDGLLNIEFDSPEYETLVVIKNTAGQAMESRRFDSHHVETIWDLTKLPRGVYYIELYHGNKKTTHKMVFNNY